MFRNPKNNLTSSKKNLSVNNHGTHSEKSLDKSTFDSSMDLSFKPLKNIAHNYRKILQSSDDEESDIGVSLIIWIS